jgi:4-diphosphocytidyl-2-C-methyl-D-erythritol kinase
MGQPSPVPFSPSCPQCQDLPDGWTLWRAPGKVNLTLRILGRREDGFHQIDSLAAKVSLYDELSFRARTEGQVTFREGPSPFACGPPEANLVLRAVRALAVAAAGRAGQGGTGAEILLTKRIPPGAGLGGGSSDAATTLAALNRLWELSWTGPVLAEIGGGIGSDVPMFLDGPAVRLGGRGEEVSPVEVYPFYAVLHLPPLACPTAEVYAAYDGIEATGNPASPCGLRRASGQPGFVAEPLRRGKQATRIRPAGFAGRAANPDSPCGLRRAGGQPAAGYRAPATGNGQTGIAAQAPDLPLAEPPSRWRDGLVNDLLPAALRVCPALSEIQQCLRQATGLPVHLTGSGSGMFILADDLAEAQAIHMRLPGDLAERSLIVRRNEW